MIQKLYLYFTMLLALLIPGCGTAVNMATSLVPSPIASATQLPESLTSVPTTTSLPTTTPAATLYSGEVEYHCIKVGDDVRQLGSLNGTLVLNGYLVPGTKNNPSLLVNMSSGNQVPLVADDLTHRFVISPSGSYLAFDVSIGNDSGKRQINVVDSAGNTLVNVVEQDLVSMEWLNDKTLLVDSQLELYSNNPLIFLSPFDHKQKVVQPFITQAERIAPFDSEPIYEWGFYDFHKIIYNPTLTRAIYAARDQNGAKLVFRDLSSNQDIYNLRSQQAWGVSPKWSPDGTKIAISLNTKSVFETMKYEIFILDQNGSRVAFWYTANEDIMRDLRLSVFDTKAQKTIDYCITNNGPAHMWHRNDTAPIWSPDGDFLLVETPNVNVDNPNVVIVDLIQEYAAIVKTGYEPVGWIK